MSNAAEISIYRRLFDEKFAEIEQLLDGLPAPALLWQPFEHSPWQGPAGSLGWLLAHALSSTVYLLRRAEWVLDRREWGAVDGDEGSQEFGPANHNPAYLLARARRVQAYVHSYLASLNAADLDASRPHPHQAERTLAVRYDTVHALEHLSQHIGHAQLTRQLWAIHAAAATGV
jgi:hypothetical protein